MSGICSLRVRWFGIVCLTIASTGLARTWADEPKTAAETSDYQLTSTHEQVVAFCEALAKDSPVVRLGSMGKSQDGRDLPLVILADPPIKTAAEAARSRKLVVFAMANIHAGEVDGKEALLMLARDIAQAKERPLLKDMIIVLAPNFNPDGNEKLGNNRPSQAGPPQVGTRENAQSLDLNRDFVKLETPEVRALTKLLVEWNPGVFIDCHTTNGSYHRYTLTYEGGRNPAGDSKLVDYVRDKLLSDVSQRLEKSTGYKSFFYGNFAQDHQAWETIPPQPRYGVHYVGLRNRVSILSESYTHSPFKDRVLASRAFVEGIFQHTAENLATIRELLASAAAAPNESVTLRYDAKAVNSPAKLLGFVEERKDGRVAPTEQLKDYDVQYLGGTVSTLSVAKPFAYLLPADMRAVAENLARHGIDVEELAEDLDLDVEVYKVDSIQKARAFQKHELVALGATARPESRRIAAGTLLIRTTQPLGALAVCLLEPQSSDGLVTWNFFDSQIAEGKDFPVLRLPAKALLYSVPTRSPVDYRTAERRPPARAFADPTWLDDGEHYLQLREGRLYKVHALSGRAESFFDPDKLKGTLAALPTIGAETAAELVTARPRMNPKRTAALFDHENDLYYGNLDGTGVARLTHTPGREEMPTFSPDGRFIAFVRGNNLYVVDVATHTERALTTDGNDLIYNGKADWVYGEEVFGRTHQTYWWSPDSSRLAFLRIDDAPVSKFTIADPTNARQRNELTPYPKAGAPNPIVTIATVSVSGAEPRWVDVSNYLDADRLIIRAGWTPDSKEMYYYVQDRAQTWLDICFYAPETGRNAKLTRQTTGAWVRSPGELQFLPGWNAKGSRQFWLASEKSGYRHYSLWDRGGKDAIKVLTSGEWDARAMHHFDDGDAWSYFSGTKDSPLGSNLYRAKAGGAIERLTPEDGDHRISFSPNGKYYVDSWSNHTTRPTVRLHYADGRLARRLDTNPDNGPERGPAARLEMVKITAPDGYVLDGSLLYPSNFNSQKKYPVWYQTYAGPGSPTIRDRWASDSDNAVTRQGYILFRCDVRSASNKGAASAWPIYKQMGVQEMKDIEAAITWLNKHEFVDSKRIGMSGHSFGGFITAYAMTHSKLFAAGIAGAPVTDWHNYDSIYTERYMGTPQENPEGYEKTSVVKAAGDLHGKLLIIHGLMDDNVHPQNSMQLVEALQRANKDFEMMIYPRSRHGIGGAHYQRLMNDFMARQLKPERGPERGSSSAADDQTAQSED